MRSAARLFAAVRQGSSQFLEPGAPTGLTGLLTHASPRSTLLYLYNSTLERLAAEFPTSSVYRQSTEALTKHRMSIIESVRPTGLTEWQARIQETVEKYPQAFQRIPSAITPGEVNIVWKEGVRSNHTLAGDEEWVDKLPYGTKRREETPFQEGPKSEDEMDAMIKKLDRSAKEEQKAKSGPTIEPEPPLTSEQIVDIENRIGAGLIEEVIQVAESERELVETLAKSRVWEDLEEKPAPGQWRYAERDTHTPETQTP